MITLGCSKPISMAFSVPTNMEYQYKSVNITNTTSKVMGQNMESNSTQEFDYTMKDLGKTLDGNHKIALNYDYIRSTQNAMGNEIVYDSKGPKEDNDPNTMRIYEAMLENPFSLVYSPIGDIIEAPGMDKMLEAMFSEVPAEAKDVLQSQMNEEVFLQMFQNISNFYPKTPIKIGGSWDQSQEVAFMGMVMNIDLTYTLKSRKDGKANIEITGTSMTSPDSPGLEMMGMTMTYDLSGTQSGILIVEESTGWPLQMNMDQNMDGSILMNNPQTGPMEIEMALDMDMSLKRL